MNLNLKKLLCLVSAIIICMGIFAGCGSSDSAQGAGNSAEGATESSQGSEGDASQNTSSIANVKQFSEEELLTGKHTAVMEIQDYGTVTLELDADQAPETVTNFSQLANDGFYDGLSFHRIITGSLIQGGSPTYDATGGSADCIKGEFSLNGVENSVSHTRGAISMARATDYNSGSCQFFIMSSDCVEYDGQYAAFGHVTEGMDIIDDICNNTAVEDWNGTVSRENQPIITSVRVD